MNLVATEILGLLSTALTTSFKQYYDGEVELPPRHLLPALMIIGNSTHQQAKSTATDTVTYDFTIRIVLDVVGSFEEAGTGAILKAQRTIRNLFEERDATGVAKSTSVLGVLRRNIRGTNYLFNNDFTITYSKLRRGKFFYYEAEMNFSATVDNVLRS